ncbi:MAG: PCP reductase family protein [Nitrospiraceae bacterium]
MHTEGIAEQATAEGTAMWFVRSECRGCGLRVGVDVPVGRAEGLVDRVMWTDDARHRLDRLPPYVAPLLKHDVESFAQQRNQRVITYDVTAQATTGDGVLWDSEAEQRLANVPSPVRAMARVELERTAADRGDARVTVALMEEVKARYFGMSASKRKA